MWESCCLRWQEKATEDKWRYENVHRGASGIGRKVNDLLNGDISKKKKGGKLSR